MPYGRNASHTWHGINAVAVLAGAEPDGINLTPESPRAPELAETLPRTVDGAAVQDTWSEVTACEAAIALGWYDEANERAEAFTVSAFHRQLRKVESTDVRAARLDDYLSDERLERILGTGLAQQPPDRRGLR
jgi:hypothetical protein